MQGDFNLDSYVLHHLTDSHEWHIPFLPTIHLPEFLSLHALMILIGASILIILFCFVYNRSARVPTGMTNALESIIIFIRDQIAVKHLGHEEGMRFAPLFCTFFFFILILNLMGLIPVFATATANINVTAALALVILSIMIFGSIAKLGLTGFIKTFIPSGVPAPVLILLIPIEVAGLFIKSFALMIRLFANMLAGHIVILSLLGIIILLGLGALPALFLAISIYILEVFVAFLQAYIFTMLSAMFIGQMLHPQH